MALAPLSTLLRAARVGGYAVGYFEAWDTYSLEAVAEAAEAEQAPVVLGVGGMTMDPTWLDRFGIEPLGAYGRTVADSLSVPAALILNEVPELAHAFRGARSGFNAVMLDTSHLPYARNVALTQLVVEFAHPRDVEVQAELGRLPSFGEEGAGELTDPARAREFVLRTGVDCLAVSVGNMHLRTDGTATVDCDRLRAIRRAVDIPLVIHGGSGLAAATVTALVAGGVSLFHVGTVMKRRYLESAQAALAADPGSADYQTRVGSRKPGDFLLGAKAAVVAAVRALMRLYGASGRGA